MARHAPAESEWHLFLHKGTMPSQAASSFPRRALRPNERWQHGLACRGRALCRDI